jgi:hypothetical protein
MRELPLNVGMMIETEVALIERLLFRQRFDLAELNLEADSE